MGSGLGLGLGSGSGVGLGLGLGLDCLPTFVPLAVPLESCLGAAGAGAAAGWGGAPLPTAPTLAHDAALAAALAIALAATPSRVVTSGAPLRSPASCRGGEAGVPRVTPEAGPEAVRLEPAPAAAAAWSAAALAAASAASTWVG